MSHTLKRISVFVLPAVLCSVLLIGCGYSLRRAPSFTSLSVGPVANNTSEPRLQDIFYDSLSAELMKRGIRVASGADYRLESSLEEVHISSTAEKEGVSVQYEVTIKGQFFLVAPDGNKTPLRGSNVFTVAFGGEGALELLTAGKELAIKRALEDLSREIAAALARPR